jgi:hypothetical protein
MHVVDLDIFLCTHNSRPGILELAIDFVDQPSVPWGNSQAVLLHGASSLAVGKEVLAPLRAAGLQSRLTREVRPGLGQARKRADLWALATAVHQRAPWRGWSANHQSERP